MKKYLHLLFTGLLLTGCQKDLLDQKPDKALLVPETLADMQSILDNTAVFNRAPTLTGLADGDYYTTDAGWKGYSSDSERQTYTWAADIFGASTNSDWNVPYQQVFYANIVLEGLDKLSASRQADELRGTALFYRAFAYYNLAQMFTLPYQPGSAATDLGLPLRLHSDVTESVPRSNLQLTYDRILADANEARKLVPLTVFYKTRPNTAAAFGLLSRFYLALRDYPQAGKYADSCLQLSNLLVDYNTLSMTAARPFTKALPNGNDEMIYYEIGNAFSYTTSTSPTYADNALYASYAAGDLRKAVFFKASGTSGTFKGTYSGVIQIFFGIATDEMYFNRAEAAARQGNTANALADLNRVLAKRWKTGTFVPLTAVNADAALALVLSERRKELFGRNLRWADLRRLNRESRFSMALTRTINGNTYTLAPDSKRYTYPIPLDEIKLGGLEQNERP
jgi:hypothetical protein